MNKTYIHNEIDSEGQVLAIVEAIELATQLRLGTVRLLSKAWSRDQQFK